MAASADAFLDQYKPKAAAPAPIRAPRADAFLDGFHKEPAPPAADDFLSAFTPTTPAPAPKPAAAPTPVEAFKKGLHEGEPLVDRRAAPDANEVVDSWDRLKADFNTAYRPKPEEKRAPKGWEKDVPKWARGVANAPTDQISAADRIGGDLMDLPASAVRQYVNKPVSQVTGLPPVVPEALELAALMAAGGGKGPSVGKPRVGKPRVEPPHTARVYGNEAHPLERLDNALYRLGGHSTADKLEAQQFLKRLPRKLPKGADSPSAREELYHALEARIFDPKAEIPEHLKGLAAEIEPYRMEQTSLINDLRKRKDPAIEPYLDDQGYVARRVKGKSPIFDAGVDGPTRGDPILGKRVLNQKTTAQQQRSAGHIVTDADGKSFFARELNDTDIKGRPYASTRQATTKEIEANTDLRYHKDAVANTVDNVVRLRAVKRNLEVLDEMKAQLKSNGMAHQEEWHYPNEKGQMVRARANQRAPEGFVAVPQIKALEGWKFDPKVAQVLKDYYPTREEGLETTLAKVNRMMTASLFVTPIPHAANVMAHWTVGRGWDWMTPGGYRRLASTGAQAAKEVLTLGPKYKQMLREGSGLLYGDTQTRNFHEAMLGKAASELEQPENYSAMDKAFGLAKLGIKSPADLAKVVYSASNKSLWAANDIFLLQRQLELEKKGMSPRMAIREAERDIPNYRIPSQVMGSRAASEFMRNPNYMLFGRYRYGQFKAWGEMFNDLYKGDPAAKKDALGKFLVAAITANAVYPLADAALKKATGNEDAKVKRAGGFALTNAAKELTTEQKDFAAAMSSVLIPAPATKAVLEGASNRDLFTGKHIIEPDSSTAGKVAQGAEYAAKSLYPAQLAIEAMKPDGGMSALGKLAGVELPPPDKEAKRQRAKKYSRSQARSREKKDALTQSLRPWMGDE